MNVIKNMIEQIYKSKNITVSRDMDPFNSDPHTSIFIEEHSSDKKVILDELIDEVQKPYSFKLWSEWLLMFVLTLTLSSTITAIYNNEVDWIILANLVLTSACVYVNNLKQKSQYKSKTLVLLFTILKVDGQL